MKRQEFGLWGEAMEMSRFRQDEFPQANQRVAIERISQPMVREPEDLELRPVTADTLRQSGTAKTEKHRRKMQQASKRRNRGRK
jgi:hypothetical protein